MKNLKENYKDTINQTDITPVAEAETDTVGNEVKNATSSCEIENSTFIKSFKKRTKTFCLDAWDYIKFAKIELIIIFAVIALDLISKLLVDRLLDVESNNPTVLIKNFLQFRYRLNNRAVFGLSLGIDKLFGDDGVMTAFIVFSIITVSVFLYCLYHFRKFGLFFRISLAFIIGGAFGNLYDRIAFGHVRDFVEIVFFGLDLPFLGETFAIFNLADSFLVVGMIMLMAFVLFIYKDDTKQNDKVEEKDADTKQNDDKNSKDYASLEEEKSDNKATYE